MRSQAKAAKKLYDNTNLNVVNCELCRPNKAITTRATTIIVELDTILGNL
jgi:hypothetical protein